MWCIYKKCEKEMSQVAVMGLGERANGYAIYEHHSDARAWSVTVVGRPSEAIFEYFEPCIEHPDCKFMFGETLRIAKNLVKNVGNFSGRIYVKFEELDVNGKPLFGGAKCSGSTTLSAGSTVGLYFNEGTGACSLFLNKEGEVILKPRPIGEHYFGIKTWSDAENEPPYPSPTAALAGAEVLPVAAEGENLAIPVTVVSVATLAGLAILARKRKLF